MYIYGRKWLYNILLTIIIVILGIISHQFNTQFDWTNNQKNSLTAASIAMLKTIEGPVLIHSYTAKIPLKAQIKKLIGRYQYHKSDIQLVFIDPAKQPEMVRTLGIQVEGELVIHLSGKTEHLTDISEEKISNTLLKLSKQSFKKLFFITGHGERSHIKQANFDLSQLSSTLQRQGFILKQSTILALKNNITTDDILILADPKGQIFDGELEALISLLEQGINFLWLVDPLNKNNSTTLQALAEYLGIELAEGVIIDPQTQALKLNRPDFTIISEYLNQHPISAKLKQTTLFPQALALDPMSENNGFKLAVFLLSSDKSWLEKSAIKGSVQFDKEDDIQGPLILAVSLQREVEESFRQRIIVMGDSDFMSNQYLGNGGNMGLGLNIFNWLSEEEQLISIAAKFYPDQRISLSNKKLVLLGIFFLIVMPILFLALGFFIVFKRNN